MSIWHTILLRYNNIIKIYVHRKINKLNSNILLFEFYKLVHRHNNTRRLIRRADNALATRLCLWGNLLQI